MVATLSAYTDRPFTRMIIVPRPTARTVERLSARWRSLSRAQRVGAALLTALVLLLAVLLPVVAGRSPAPSGAPPPSSAPPSSAPPGAPPSSVPPTPSAPESPGGAVSPLTGLPGGAGRILAVKVDNIVNARPQTGLGAADVVYAIEVEGGLSRFLAVYDSNHLPPGDSIGPVRSARESDLPVLQQYGKVDFAYSGAQTKFLPVLARADLFNCSPAQDNSFFRGRWDVPPFNQYVVPSGILQHFPDAAAARDVGFRFGPAPAGGAPADTLTARMPAASFTFTWSPGEGRYLVSIDGKPAGTTDSGRLGASSTGACSYRRHAFTTGPVPASMSQSASRRWAR
ncbi:DUF3048 domain-containing protein, partial [Kitasatospora sp. NPDC047058]|uniref:DUF3048 N-terminal domain-containing protein n=1 Tax=Kitasatospora sp. NPDC047058 TaxID=3155620 RepID=UPI0033D65BF1